MDVPSSENSLLKDKSMMLGNDIDEVAVCIGGITLVDKSDDGKVPIENDIEGVDIQSNELPEVDKQSYVGEKVEKKIEDVDKHSNEFLNEEITRLESIEEEGTQSKVTDKIQSKVTDESELSDKESNLKELLQSLQCPFSWKFENTEGPAPDYTLAQIKKKIKEIEEEDSFQWRKFILTLVLCYEYYTENNIDLAFDELKKCEEFINNSNSKGYFEYFFQSVRIALMHVVFACKCYFFLDEGDLDEVERILDNIYKEEDMDNSCKAALWGIKGAVSMEYGYEGTKVAHDYLKKALELDKEQAEWYFLLGKCLGRIRRIDHYSEIPSHEELKALEEAVAKSKSPSYIIILAQSYREAAFRAYSLNRFDLDDGLENKIDSMNKRSFQLYCEALELQGDCSHVNMRCAQGFLKFPHRYRDIKRARECSDKALEVASDNPMAHHIRGSIYEFEHDYDNAKKHYEKSGEIGAYGALMDLQKLEYKLDKSYNPIPKFEYMLQRYTEKPRREEILCQMGSYYFFIKEDLLTAFREYWRQVIIEEPHSERLKIHKCTFLHMLKPVSIYKLLYDEARRALRTTDSKCGEDKKLLREIVLLCMKECPDLDEGSPKPIRKMILDESYDKVKSHMHSYRERGRGFHGQEQRRGRSEHYNRNRNEREDYNSFEGSRNRDSNTRYIPRNRNTNADSRSRNQGNERDADNSYEGSRNHNSNTRYIPRNSYTNADSRPGQRFSRRRNDSDWRASRDKE